MFRGLGIQLWLRNQKKNSRIDGEGADMQETILEMRDIVKVFAGVHALNGVRLEIKKGEVHALIGENGAGKSTLMKILLGIYKPDGGEIYFKGKKVEFANPNEALKNGISMIHQEICLVPGMDVAENIWLGREHLFKKAGMLNKKKRYEETRDFLDGLGIHINPGAYIKDLSVAHAQLVELARAVSYQADVIIMDEPTSAFTTTEVDILYAIVRKLAAQGTAIIFISHKLEEIYEICTKVTVLRDGTYVATKGVEELPMEQLIPMIVGRKQEKGFEKENYAKDNVVLEVKGFNSAGVFSDINFQVHEGEVLGFSGLMGAGRTEIMESLFGIRKFTSGQVFLNGEEVHINSPKEAVRLGIGMVTEDRLNSGAIYSLSVMQNTTIVEMSKLANKIGVYSHRKEKDFFQKAAKTFEVKYSSADEGIGQLSGGNQQKVIFARWLASKPKILILDEPTRGIDVGSKGEIYKLIAKLAKQGMAILFVSSELPELLALSDRIHVIRDGRLVYTCSHEEATQETLIAHAFGVAKQEETKEA